MRPYRSRIKGYSVVVLTGTDALRLDTFVRPYNGLLVLSFYNSSPTHKGSINQEPSSVRGSFGALPLRPTAMIRRTSARSFCVRLSIMLLVLQHLLAELVVLM